MEPTRKGKAKMEFDAWGQLIYDVLSQRNVSTLNFSLNWNVVMTPPLLLFVLGRNLCWKR